MLGWLFKKNKSVENTETNFLKLSIGQQFQKIGCYDEKTYIKIDDIKYQTTNNEWRCSHWYLVREDFTVKIVN